LSTERTSELRPAEPSHEAGLRIGTDEWVAQAEARRRRRSGALGKLADRWAALPPIARIGLFALLLLAAPVVTAARPVLDLLGISNNGFIVRIGATFLASSILAVGLNVVVGYAGLLDLGYVAFYGLAGYAYAYLSSDFINGGVHLPSILSVPLIIAFTALMGWFLGSLSIRLYGDYLAIVTLGFGQLFVQLASTLTRVKVFWLDKTVDLTRGPNGINNLDNVVLFGYSFRSTLQYYYLFFVMLAVVLVVVHHMNQSRIGRAWRAMREDDLAADVMGMPTRRLKLIAFAIGAAIAALAGTVLAAWQGSVTPGRYDLLALIDLYAMVVLGGIGSLAGVVLGAFVFTILPELLRSVELAGYLFYLGGLLGLIWWLKPSRRLVVLLAGAFAGGLVFKLLIHWFLPGLDSGAVPSGGSFLNQAVQSWLVIPEKFKAVGNVAIGAAVLMLLVTILLKPPLRWLTLGLTLYLFAFAWETRLATEPSVTRVLITGVTLIVLMIFRPEGLLGEPRVSVG